MLTILVVSPASAAPGGSQLLVSCSSTNVISGVSPAASADVSPTVVHYAADGAVLGTLDVSGKLGGCGNSGIAGGAGDLFLADNGCSQLYRMNKTGGTVPWWAAIPRGWKTSSATTSPSPERA